MTSFPLFITAHKSMQPPAVDIHRPPVVKVPSYFPQITTTTRRPRVVVSQRNSVARVQQSSDLAYPADRTIVRTSNNNNQVDNSETNNNNRGGGGAEVGNNIVADSSHGKLTVSFISFTAFCYRKWQFPKPDLPK